MMIKHGSWTEWMVEQRTPVWLALRAGKITGSNFGAALSIDQYTSMNSLIKRIREDKGFSPNKFMQHGTRFEPVAEEQYKKSMGMDVQPVGFAVPDKHPWCGCSPDGIAVESDGLFPERILLEIKCPATKRSYDGVPPGYMAQVQGNMHVLGLDTAHFVVYRPNNYGFENFDEADFDEGPRSEKPVTPWSMEVWEIKHSKEYCEAMFKGLDFFMSKRIDGAIVRGETNPFRPAVLAASLEVKLSKKFGGVA